MAIIVPIEEAEGRFAALADLVEQGETVVVTRNGHPILDLIPHRQHGILRRAAVREFKRKYGLDEIFSCVADDFDEPLSEDFLLKALP